MGSGIDGLMYSSCRQSRSLPIAPTGGYRRPSACNTYFESLGVAIAFGDGGISPFVHAQRLTATSRDCIKAARVYLDEGDRSLAVQWAMAARIENTRVRDWLGNHPDAVLEALRHCCW